MLWLTLAATHNLALKALQELANVADLIPALGILGEELALAPGLL